jgi:hypothetical protein
LRLLAKEEADPRVVRRLLAIAGALEGLSREAAARLAGMNRQTLRIGSSATIAAAPTRCTTIGAMAALVD